MRFNDSFDETIDNYDTDVMQNPRRKKHGIPKRAVDDPHYLDMYRPPEIHLKKEDIYSILLELSKSYPKFLKFPDYKTFDYMVDLIGYSSMEYGLYEVSPFEYLPEITRSFKLGAEATYRWMEALHVKYGLFAQSELEEYLRQISEFYGVSVERKVEDWENSRRKTRGGEHVRRDYLKKAQKLSEAQEEQSASIQYLQPTPQLVSKPIPEPAISTFLLLRTLGLIANFKYCGTEGLFRELAPFFPISMKSLSTYLYKTPHLTELCWMSVPTQELDKPDVSFLPPEYQKKYQTLTLEVYHKYYAEVKEEVAQAIEYENEIYVGDNYLIKNYEQLRYDERKAICVFTPCLTKHGVFAGQVATDTGQDLLYALLHKPSYYPLLRYLMKWEMGLAHLSSPLSGMEKAIKMFSNIDLLGIWASKAKAIELGTYDFAREKAAGIYRSEFGEDPEGFLKNHIKVRIDLASMEAVALFRPKFVPLFVDPNKYNIYIPRTSYDLSAMGRILNNCIGTKVPQCTRMKHYLFHFYRKSKKFSDGLTVEFTEDGKFANLFGGCNGIHNRPPNPNERELLEVLRYTEQNDKQKTIPPPPETLVPFSEIEPILSKPPWNDSLSETTRQKILDDAYIGGDENQLPERPARREFGPVGREQFKREFRRVATYPRRGNPESAIEVPVEELLDNVAFRDHKEALILNFQGVEV